MKVLVTGATGYIGGRLVPKLLERGHAVRVLARDPRRLGGRAWAADVEVVAGNLLEPDTLEAVFDGVDAACYLVHSMYAGGDYDQRDRRAAENFCSAAAGLSHVVYLGGLLPQGAPASRHLRSRAEIGRILASHLPTTELRAGPIIGSGSASFEMVRYLTERLPHMIAPRWVHNQVLPVAVRDVQSYLMAALERGPSGIVDIGADPLTFRQMLGVYAELRGLHRAVLSVPSVLPAHIGARWIGLVTPIPNALAVPLIEGIVRPLLGDTGPAAKLFPQIEPIPYRRAVELALLRIEEQAVATRWSGTSSELKTVELRDYEGLIREVRTLHVEAHPAAVFKVFTSLGGARGWLVWNWAWWIRGMIDRVLGGPGLRRGRRDPQELLPGEAVDFWRVETVSPPQLLRLRAEIRLPGRAWLQWRATPEAGGTRLTQTASFAPQGLPGALYWYFLYPFHKLIFTDMIQEIGRLAAAPAPDSPAPDPA